MPTSTSATGSRGDGGFTLLELLIAVSILALTFALLTSGIRFGVAAWEKGTDIGTHAAEVRSAHRIIRRQIERLRPALERGRRGKRQVAFIGEPEEMRFIAPPPAQPAPPGVYLIRLRIAPSPDGRRLSIAWRRLQPDYADFAETGDMESVVLGDGFADGAIAYFGRARGEDAARWHERWVARDIAPALIRIRLNYSGDEDRHWPDLIAAPLIGALR